MKNILFVINHMHIGGPQRSLLNLLSVIDYTQFNVFVQTFRKGGVLLNEIPKNVSVSFIEPSGLFNPITLKSISSLNILVLKFAIRLINFLNRKIFKTNNSLFWRFSKPFIQKSREQFDIAIAYQEGPSIYYINDKIDSLIKIGRIPTDYKTACLDKSFDYPYFEKLDKIFVVSSETKNIFISIFPEFESKTIEFYSILSKEYIEECSLRGYGFHDNHSGWRILTIARLDITKGIDIAIYACSLLVSKGIDVKWYFLGDGKKPLFTKIINKLKLDRNIIFLNPTPNPYKYIAQCDIYVQPSRYEGRSNAVNEAKALEKPIILTNYTTASEHITHDVTGIITEAAPEALADSVEKLINNPELRRSFSKKLSEINWNTKDEINKLTSLAK